jgi:hypothetical protein
VTLTLPAPISARPSSAACTVAAKAPYVSCMLGVPPPKLNLNVAPATEVTVTRWM